jgi:hypothetical protein
VSSQLHIDPTAIAKEVIGHQLRDAVRSLCKENFLIFQKVELGMEIGPQHKLWADHLKSRTDVVEVAPRDHGKSMSIARAYPLWKVKYDDWVKEVLLLGADQDSAVENLDKIKQMLDDTPSLNYLVPKTRRDNFYSRTEIKLTNGKTIRAKGIGSPLRGRHPQLIVGDDILNERNSLDPVNRAEIKQYFFKVIMPMKDKGLQKDHLAGHRSQIALVGTAQDYDDLYHELINNPHFVGEKLKAILDESTQQVLWPERYSYDDLVKIRATVGALVFAQEYQNEPISDETSLFPRSLFAPMYDYEQSYVQSYNGPNPVFMGVDFSVPGSTDGDWTVIFVVEKLPDDRYKILNFWRAQPGSMNEQIHKIELFCQMYNVTLGYLEDNMFQKVYANHFTRNSSLPLSGNTVTWSNKNSKTTGILGFRPLFENERFILPYKEEPDRIKTEELVSEFTGVRQRKGKIGNEQTHDDIVLAAWHAIRAATAGSTFNVSW